MEWSPQLLAALRSGRPISEWSPAMVAELEATQKPAEAQPLPRAYEPGLPAGTTTQEPPGLRSSVEGAIDDLLGRRTGPPPPPPSLEPTPTAPVMGPPTPERYQAAGGGGGGGMAAPPPAAPGMELLERWRASPPPASGAPSASTPPAAPEAAPAPAPGDGTGERRPALSLAPENEKLAKEEQLGKYEAIKGVMEGLGSFHAPTASEILLNQPRPEPFQIKEPQSIEQLRADVAGASDPHNDPTSEVSKRYQALAAQLFPGMDLSKSSAAELSDVLPFLDRAAGREQDQAQFEASTAAREQAGAGVRTQKDREALDAYQDARADWEQIRQLKEKVNTGPISNIWNSFRETIGFPNIEWSTFRAQLLGRINRHIQAMTGAQMSKEEAARLSRELPKMSDSDELFIANLDQVVERIDQYHQNWTQTRGMEGASSATTGAAAGAKVLVRDPNGKLFKLPESQLEEALGKGYTRG